VKKYSLAVLILFLLNFGLPANSFAADSIGPKITQRNSSSTEDATNSGITIDIYYAVEDESGVDETRVPETFIRLPGKELESSLRARPTLMSGNIYNGSWLARFTYSKGIPPGIYVASTSTWYDTQGNPSSIPTAVTIRVDNLAITSSTGENTPPSNIKCNPPQQIYGEEEEFTNQLSASIFCTFTANSLRNGYKVNAYLEKVPLNVPEPIFNYVNDQISYPRSLVPQKIGKTFNLTNTFPGEYTLRIVVEFLSFPNLTQTFNVKLSRNSKLPATGSDPDIDPLSCLNEGGVSRIDGTWYLCTLIEGKKVRVPQPDNFPEIRQAKLDMEELFRQVDKLKVNLNSILKESRITRTLSIREYEQRLVTFRTAYQNKSPNAETVLRAKNEYNSLDELSRQLLNTVGSAKLSITCTKGKTIKKVSGTNPKCPKGYRAK
jgi:hypothetical protein